MKKKIIIAIIAILLITTAIVCNLNFKDKDDKKENVKISDSVRFKKEYESLNNKINENNQKKYLKVNIDKENVIKYASVDKALEVLDSKSGIIYFGFPTCPWCRNIVPVLLNAATSTGIGQIYYLDMSEVRDLYELDNNNKAKLVKEGKKGYKDLLKKLDSILDDYTLETTDKKEVKVGEKRIFVPLVVFIKDGKIIAHHTDTVDSQKDPYIKLNNDQTEELYNIYVDAITKMQNSSCDDNC